MCDVNEVSVVGMIKEISIRITIKVFHTLGRNGGITSNSAQAPEAFDRLKPFPAVEDLCLSLHLQTVTRVRFS